MDRIDFEAAVIVLLIGIAWTLHGIKDQLRELSKKFDAK